MIKFFALSLLFTASLAQAASIDVYFGTRGRVAKGIYHAKLDTDSGKLSEPKVAAEIASPGFLALHPDKDKLYAVGQSKEGGIVAAYKINKGGTLDAINTSSVGKGTSAHVAAHPSGKMLLTAQYGAGTVSVFPLSENGAVGPCSQVISHQGGSGVVENRQDAPHPHWVGFSPDGRFAFVPDLGLDQIVIYKVDVNKPAIVQHGVAQSIPGGGPRHMRFSPDGKFIYLLNELTLSTTTFKYDAATGTAKRLTTTPALSETLKSKELFNSSSEILVHPSGKFVFSANRGNDSVTAYKANPKTGKLSVTEVEPIRGSWPRNINMDPSGKWLLAAGADSSTISVFGIDQNSGELTYQTKSTINVPESICIIIKD